MERLALPRAAAEGGADVHNLHLDAAIAAELVYLQVKRRVYAAARAAAALLRRRGEENPVELGAALAQAHLEVPVLADVLRPVKRCPLQAEERAAVARAVRLERAQLLHLLQRDAPRVQDRDVHVQHGNGRLPAAELARVLVHPRAEGRDIALFDREARGQLMPAEAKQKINKKVERIEFLATTTPDGSRKEASFPTWGKLLLVMCAIMFFISSLFMGYCSYRIMSDTSVIRNANSVDEEIVDSVSDSLSHVVKQEPLDTVSRLKQNLVNDRKGNVE